MDGIVSHLGQQPTEVFGEAGIDEESHVVRREALPSPRCAECDGCVLECGEEVVSFQVSIVGKDLFGGHTGRQKLEKRLHRVPQAANDRPTVTDGLVARDSVQV